MRFRIFREEGAGVVELLTTSEILLLARRCTVLRRDMRPESCMIFLLENLYSEEFSFC